MIIPAAFTAVLIFFAALKDDGLHKPDFTSQSQTQFSQEVLSYKPKRPKKEYQTIYDYIKENYKKVSDKDAKSIAKHLVSFGHQYKIDPKLLAALVSQESSFDKNAISKTGAKGLGQIKSFNFKSLEIKNPYDIKQNIRGTTRYIKRMLDHWKEDNQAVEMAFASYFKGAQAVKDMNRKIDKETKTYVRGILEKYRKIKE